MEAVLLHRPELGEEHVPPRLRPQLLLLRIAEKEKLEVNDTDMLMAVSEMARRYEIPVKKLVKDLQSREGFGPIREQILMGKALDLIAANVTVREPAGGTAKA